MNTTSLLNLANPQSEANGEWKVNSPAQTDTVIGTCLYRYSDIEIAIQGAVPILAEPKARVFAIAEAHRRLQEHKEELFSIAQKELGRTDEELELEWSALETYLTALTGDEAILRSDLYSRGIAVALGSYVWPLFYSAQFALMNFIAGNPVILKPSEKATLTVHALVKVLRSVPDLKSIQVLVGEREVGRRLATHEAVSTILFQGSFEVGMRVKQDALSQPSKEVLLYLGSKNAAVVFGDSEAGVEEHLLKDAFLNAGQHCRSVSIIFVEKSRLDSFQEKFHELSKAFKIGGPGTGALMGPLVDGAVLDRYLKFIGISEREGAEVLMRGKPFVSSEKGHFVTPSIALFQDMTTDRLKKSVSLQTEILSPHVSIVGFENEAELIALMNQMTHGRLASLWTLDAKRANRIARALAVGEVVVNQSVFRFDPWATVQGRKRSGNHARLGRGLLSQLTYKKVIH